MNKVLNFLLSPDLMQVQKWEKIQKLKRHISFVTFFFNFSFFGDWFPSSTTELKITPIEDSINTAMAECNNRKMMKNKKKKIKKERKVLSNNVLGRFS
jgi:hypothetical protein